MRQTLLLLLAPLFLAIALAPSAGQDAVDPPKPRPEAAAEAAPVPLPRPRPEEEAEPEEAAPEATEPDATEPEAAEERAAGTAAGDETKTEAPDEGLAEGESSDPLVPARIYQSGCPAVIAGDVVAELQAPIADKQCGAQSPWLVTAVAANGRLVPLSSGATTSCEMASALPGWIAEIDRYLWARENTRVAEVTTSTSYFCRNVNNAKTGNLSFHSFANALDVTGFKLEDGRTVTVEGGWGDALSTEGRLLRFAHDSACARFTTTLGPEANALHRDHLHLDMGCHGKACTARLCE